MDSLLTQTAVIVRRDPTIVGPDPFAVHAEVPCRMTGASGSRVLELPIGTFTVTHIVYLQADVDVAESDRIVEVKDVANNVLAADLRIGLVRRVAARGGATHHLELLCSAWKDSG